MSPPPDRRQCQATTSLRPDAITGVPASQASIIVREKLSTLLVWT